MQLTDRCAIGLDLGGTQLKFGVVDATGRMLFNDSCPAETAGGRSGVLKVMGRAVGESLKIASKKGWDVAGIGAGCPGNIDVSLGVSLGPTPHIHDWEGAEIGAFLRKKSGLPVLVDNDANFMTYAESAVGAGRDYKYVVGMTLGTGIGGGIVMDGEIYHGAAFNAAELGHVSVEINGRACSCGNRGCVERYAGAKYIVQDVVSALEGGSSSLITQGLESTSAIDPTLIFAAARHGDELCGRIIQQMIDSLAAAISSTVNVLNPDIIVIGGGMSEAAGFVQRIASAVTERLMKPAKSQLRIVRAQLGNSAGMIGAALHVLKTTT
ncbi:MAG: ROK family protein [Bacteroidetes bacterium]|nr:ROK family protein [Bacteroidota bacterium]